VGGDCVATCGPGSCCFHGACRALFAPFTCIAADGTCAVPGDSGCPCCDADAGNLCVADCGTGRCCSGGACVSTCA
jgi:hypothetical protein